MSSGAVSAGTSLDVHHSTADTIRSWPQASQLSQSRWPSASTDSGGDVSPSVVIGECAGSCWDDGSVSFAEKSNISATGACLISGKTSKSVCPQTAPRARMSKSCEVNLSISGITRSAKRLAASTSRS